jgi:dCTP deaminase
MILSNLEIHKALDEGRLIIKPEPLPRKPTIGQDCPYDTHTVDLKLGNIITVPKAGSYAYDYMSKGKVADLISKNSEKIILTQSQPYHLKTGEFVLGQTLETIELPTDKGSPYLAARIEGKSSWARCGLLVHFTAPTVHPQWSGPLTLEIINLGKTPFLLHNRMPIAQLIVEEVKGEIEPNPSQFHGQSTPEGTILR